MIKSERKNFIYLVTDLFFLSVPFWGFLGPRKTDATFPFNNVQHSNSKRFFFNSLHVSSRQYFPPTLSKTNSVAISLAISRHNHFISILKKLPCNSLTQVHWFSTLPGKFQHRAVRVRCLKKTNKQTNKQTNEKQNVSWRTNDQSDITSLTGYSWMRTRALSRLPSAFLIEYVRT